MENENICQGYDEELLCCTDPECEEHEEEHRAFYEEFLLVCDHDNIKEEDRLSYEEYVKTGAGNRLMQLCMQEAC